MFLLRRSRSEGSRRASPCFSSASAIGGDEGGVAAHPQPEFLHRHGRVELEQRHGVAAGQPEFRRDALAEVVGVLDEFGERIG